jgi:UDP-N-acetylmuramate dehydrogenase
VSFAQALLAAGYESEIAEHRPIGPYTTYKVGGSARVLTEVATRSDLALLGSAVRDAGLPVLIVGRGSNLLVADAGFSGVMIVLGAGFAEAEFAGTFVTAGGAVALPALARQSVSKGLTGFEWAVGVPGSIGGAVRMNAGGHGADIAASLVRVDVYDLDAADFQTISARDLALSYRSSALGSAQIVVSASIQLELGDRATSQAELSEIVRWRREHQPGGQNAGSVFTNPEGTSAGALIDQTGLKGFRIGTARVSEKHANFIQSDPNGSADDIRALMQAIQDRVKEATGIHLHPETVLVGFESA